MSSRPISSGRANSHVEPSKEAPTLGVIGAGSVAQHAYLPLAATLKARGALGRIVAADPDETALADVRRRFPIDQVSTDARAILDDPTVDVVLVLTPMALHAEMATRALRASKHVLVEKPIGTTLREAREVLEAAGTSSGLLLCAPHVLLSRDYQRMYRTIRDGGIGRPVAARARYGWDGPDWSPWFYERGGGPLFDLGVYNVTTLTGLLGPVARVTSMSALHRTRRRVAGRQIDVELPDTFQVGLQHRSGALSTVTTAFGMQKYRGPAIEVYGLDGTIQMLGDDWAPEGLEYWSNTVGAWQLLDSESRYWPWTDGLTHLLDCIRTGAQPYTPIEQAFHVVEVMLAAEKAAETGATQDVNSSFVQAPPLPAAGDRAEAHRVHDRVHEDAQ
jgi:predicted dehydrogenase